MPAILYLPTKPPHEVALEEQYLPALSTGQAYVSAEVASLLGCAQHLVDILDCGADYVAYSIFDYEGAPNPKAMSALAAISAHSYDIKDDDQVLQGPVLVITA